MNIIVFGGSKGIGRVFVDRMLSQGNNVTVLSRSFKQNNKLAQPNFIPADLSQKESILSALNKLVESGEKFDCLVFCQRYRGDKDSAWDGEINSSLLTFKLAVEILSPNMPKNSSIVAISSSAAKLVAAEQPVGYHMAKAGLEHMIRYYAVQLGEKGIKVNGVAPPVTIKPENEEFYRLNPNLVDTICAAIPLGRMCNAEDVCDVIEFLSTTTYVNGQIIIVDGGLSLTTQESTAKKLAKINDADLIHPKSN